MLPGVEASCTAVLMLGVSYIWFGCTFLDAAFFSFEIQDCEES